jgi:hypothetical protein
MNAVRSSTSKRSITSPAVQMNAPTDRNQRTRDKRTIGGDAVPRTDHPAIKSNSQIAAAIAMRTAIDSWPHVSPSMMSTAATASAPPR